jgi:hypothetical protein
MKTEEKVLTMGLRETLKVIMRNEIEKLPEILESLEPMERANVLCKIMPYVFPKVESVNLKVGEPFTFD